MGLIRGELLTGVPARQRRPVTPAGTDGYGCAMAFHADIADRRTGAIPRQIRRRDAWNERTALYMDPASGSSHYAASCACTDRRRAHSEPPIWFLWDGRSDARLGAHNWIICMKRPAAGGRPPRRPGRCCRDPDALPHRPPTPRAEMARYPGVMETTTALGEACVVDLAELRPELPASPPHGHTAVSSLRHLAEQDVEFGAVEGLALGCALDLHEAAARCRRRSCRSRP